MSRPYRFLLLVWSVVLLASQGRAAAPPHSHQIPLPPGAVWRFGLGYPQHAQTITSIAYSPDGKILASCGEDYALRLWDAAASRLLRTLMVRDNYDPVIAFSPDGKVLAVGCSVSYGRLPVSLRDVRTGKEIRGLAGFGSKMHCITFTPDSRKLIGGSASALDIWDVSTGKRLRSVAGIAIDAIAIASDGKTVITRTRGRIDLRGDLGEKKPVTLESRSSYKAMAVIPRNLLALMPLRGRLELWNLARRRPERSFHCSRDQLHSVAASPDGKLVAASSGDMVFLWNVTSGELLRQWSVDVVSPARERDPLRGLTFSPDSKRLAAIKENMIFQWDVATGKEWMPPGPFAATVRDVQLSADGRILAARDHTTINVWDAESGRTLHRLDNLRTKAMHLDRQGKLLQLWDPAAGMRVLDLATGKLSLRWKTTSAMKDTDGAVFSPDGRKLLLWSEAYYAGKGKLFQCNTADGKGIAAISEIGEGSGTPLVAYSPDGRLFALADGLVRQGIRLWAAVPIKQRARLLPTVRDRLGSYSVLAFSVDGSLLAAGTYAGEIHLWDTVASRAIPPLKRDNEPIYALAFSPDGKMLASDGPAGVVLWDIASGQVRRRFSGHGRAVVSICFARGSQMLVSGSADRTVLWWDVWGDDNRDAVPPLDSVWVDLVGEDASKTFQAARAWRRVGGHGVRLLQALAQAQMRPVKPADPLDTALLIQNLEDDSVAVRNSASRQLAKLGESVVAALEKARTRPLTVEAQIRIDKLLAPSRERRLREERAWLRVVEMLEQTSIPEAKSMLASLARKAPSARVAQEAGAALKRREER